MNLVACAESAVSAAAEHGVGVHLTAQFGPGFGDEAGEPDDAVHLGGLGRQLGGWNDASALFALLNHVQVITPDGGDEERGLEGGLFFACVAVIFNEIEKLTRPTADGVEKGEVLRAEPSLVLRFSRAVEGGATIKEEAKICGPSGRAHVGQ